MKKLSKIKMTEFILILIIVLVINISESFAAKLCNLNIDDKFNDINNNQQIKAQFQAFLPNLKYYYTNSDTRTFILLSDTILNGDLVNNMDAVELNKSADILFNRIKESLIPRAKIHNSLKRSYPESPSRVEVAFEYTENIKNSISIFEKRIVLLASDNCFINVISISPLENKEQNVQELSNFLKNLVANNKNKLPASLPKESSREIEICGHKIKRKYYKVGLNQISEKPLLQVMPHLKYYYFSDDSKASYLLGEYSLNKRESQYLSLEALRASIPELKKAITEATPVSVKINSFEGKVFDNYSSGIEIKLDTQLDKKHFFENRIALFASPTCRIDFIASGSKENQNLIEQEVAKLHSDLIDSGSLPVLPEKYDQNKALLKNGINGALTGGVTGLLIASIFYGLRYLWKKIKIRSNKLDK